MSRFEDKICGNCEYTDIYIDECPICEGTMYTRTEDIEEDCDCTDCKCAVGGCAGCV